MEENKTQNTENMDVCKPSEGEKKDNFLAISILASAIIVAGTLFIVFGPKETENEFNERNANKAAVRIVAPQIGDSVVLGDTKALVDVIVFADYQCPWCGKFYSEVEGPIVEKYVKSGKVKMAYKNFSFLGPESTEASLAGLCAKDEGKFWQYHDAIFDAEVVDAKENNGNLNTAFFFETAKKLGLNEANFKTCLESKKYSNTLKQEISEASASGVNSTPTIFVNGKKVENPFEDAIPAIELALKGK